MEKITKREMFEALVAYANACDMDVEINDTAVTSADFVAFATKEIEQLDKKAVKAKERAAAKRAEGDALTEMVLNALTADFQTAKVSYRLGALVKEGKAVKEDIKVDRDGKKAVLKGYKLA